MNPQGSARQVKGQLLHRLGVKTLAEGDTRRAVFLLERALQCDPSNFALLNNLGGALLAGGNPAIAASHLRKATHLNSGSSELHRNLGVALDRLGDRDAARQSLLRALAAEPGFQPASLSLAEILFAQGDTSTAERQLKQILASTAGDIDALLLLGRIYESRCDWERAADCFDSVLISQPSHLGAMCALSTVVSDARVGSLTTRLESAACTAGSEEWQFRVHQALSVLAHRRRDIAGEFHHRRRALEYRPNAADVQVGLAKLSLLTGDFDSGWRTFEWRWSQAATVLPPRGLLRRRWSGEPLRESGILLHAEQGVGSIIQFSRYAPLVVRRGGRVVLEVPAKLARLMSTLDGVAEVVVRGESLPAVDWQCPLMSLPLAFGTLLGTIPAEVPYLHADPQLVRRRAEQLPAKFRVVIACAGAPWHYNDRRRSIPAELLAPLGEVAEAGFVSLQHPPGNAAATGIALSHCELNDFADTAAVIANLDLVITVDTAVAHLAGALGRPVWIMLPFAAEYRWLLGREDSPWYPTARLFRQPSPGDWHSVITDVARELRRQVRGKNHC